MSLFAFWKWPCQLFRAYLKVIGMGPKRLLPAPSFETPSIDIVKIDDPLIESVMEKTPQQQICPAEQQAHMIYKADICTHKDLFYNIVIPTYNTIIDPVIYQKAMTEWKVMSNVPISKQTLMRAFKAISLSDLFENVNVQINCVSMQFCNKYIGPVLPTELSETTALVIDHDVKSNIHTYTIVTNFNEILNIGPFMNDKNRKALKYIRSMNFNYFLNMENAKPKIREILQDRDNLVSIECGILRDAVFHIKMLYPTPVQMEKIPIKNQLNFSTYQYYLTNSTGASYSMKSLNFAISVIPKNIYVYMRTEMGQILPLSSIELTFNTRTFLANYQISILYEHYNGQLNGDFYKETIFKIPSNAIGETDGVSKQSNFFVKVLCQPITELVELVIILENSTLMINERGNTQIWTGYVTKHMLQ